MLCVDRCGGGGEEELNIDAMQGKHVIGLASFRCSSALAGFTPHALRCSISDTLVLVLDETVVFYNRLETFEIRVDNIMYGLDDKLSVNFLF